MCKETNSGNLKTHREQVPPLFEIFDSRQPVEHTLQPPTLSHDPSHLVHLLVILLLICDAEKRQEVSGIGFMGTWWRDVKILTLSDLLLSPVTR